MSNRLFYTEVRRLTEINRTACYHKPVDVWAMGVITYFILCGCTPFDWDSEAKEENAAIEAIVAGDYEFELIEHWENECWENFSETAKDFILRCLTVNPTKRPSAQDMLEHKWLSGNLQCFNAKRTCKFFFSSPRIVSHRLLSTVRKTVFVVIAIKRMTTLTSLSPGPGDFDHDLQRYKEGSKEVRALITPSLLPSYPVTRSAHRK